MINEQIRDKEVRLIGEDGEQLGIVSSRDALKMAEEAGLDLVKIAPTAKPPVCKIVDYGKYKYEQVRKEKEAKKKQHVTEVKPLRLSPVIDKHDFETKLRHARSWLEDGMKVKIDMRFRGRMMTRLEVGRKIMDSFIEECADIATVEKKPLLEGNTMSTVMAPKKK